MRCKTIKITCAIAAIGLIIGLAGCQLKSSADAPSEPRPTAAVLPNSSTAEAAQTPKVDDNASVKSDSFNLLLTNSASGYISFLDPEKGTQDKLDVGKSPFGIALASSGTAYISTAEGIAVVDTKQRKRLALIPYQSQIGPVQYGEYRPGGMGIAVSPDGRYVYVGVYLKGKPSQLEILDTEKLVIVGSVPVGIRPFDVVVSKDGHEVYTIDHDSYSVTVVNPAALSTRKLDVAPFGRGGFEKPHYTVVREDGRLLLPYQGRGLVILDPKSGEYETQPLTGNTHQEGLALTQDGKKLLIVGNGAAGSATGKPNLTVLDVATMAEQIIPLNRVHQMVASSPDGRWAYLTGGVTFADTGWDGLTIVDLSTGSTKEITVSDYPLDIEIIPN
ncbi:MULTISPECIES: YncE family protein [unclassified Paenibacillus]|uniref:YncE family protein n=1 Tax=unclassified Paenibacillus TaxID=185978 RepID=UPI003632D917